MPKCGLYMVDALTQLQTLPTWHSQQQHCPGWSCEMTEVALCLSTLCTHVSPPETCSLHPTWQRAVAGQPGTYGDDILCLHFMSTFFFWWLLLVQLVRWKAVWSHVVAHVILRTWERPCNVSTVTPALITSSLYLSWAVAHLCSFSRIMLFSYCILWRSHHFCSFHSSMHCNCNHYKWATLYSTLRKLPCEREGQAKNVFILDFWVEH